MILQQDCEAASTHVSPVCKPDNLPAARRRWLPSGVPGIVQYVPSGTYFGIAKVHKKSRRINLGSNLKIARRDFRTWKAKLKITVRSPLTSAPKEWSHYAALYRQEVLNRVDLADPSKRYLIQRLDAIERTWPDAAVYRTADSKPKPTLENLAITAMTMAEVAGWAASYVRSYSPTAYNNSAAVLKAVFQKAVDAGVISQNPAASLGRVGESNQPLKWFPSPQQWQQIINVMRSIGRGACRRAADLAELICYSGCRLSEVCRVRWADVDFLNKTMTIRGSKGRQKGGGVRLRVVPLHDRLEELLLRLRGPQPSEWPATRFVASAKECLGTLQHACRNLKIRPLTHHDLRHIFATWCVEQGVDIPAIADMLGHRDGGRLLLSRYRHSRADHLVVVGSKMKF